MAWSTSAQKYTVFTLKALENVWSGKPRCAASPGVIVIRPARMCAALRAAAALTIAAEGSTPASVARQRAASSPSTVPLPQPMSNTRSLSAAASRWSAASYKPRFWRLPTNATSLPPTPDGWANCRAMKPDKDTRPAYRVRYAGCTKSSPDL